MSINNKTKLICTLGPSSYSSDVIDKMIMRGVHLFRINMSHTRLNELDSIFSKLNSLGINICLDTEGCQVRTGFLGISHIDFKEQSIVKLYGKKITCDENNIFIRPKETLKMLRVGDIISLDFNSVMLKVTDRTQIDKKGFINCVVINGGIVGNNKGVDIVGKRIHLPAFSEKDIKALKIAARYNIQYFTLSFIDNAKEVKDFKKLYEKPCKIISKIETRLGLQNYREILNESDGILIDRGDLSREVQLVHIQFVQKFLINASKKMKKECYIATNILESMCTNIKPNRNEINDIINLLSDGATGVVLTKETAIGENPVETVNMAMGLIENQTFMVNFIDSPEEAINHMFSDVSNGLLVLPHGGKLINRVNLNISDKIISNIIHRLKVSTSTLREISLITNGTFSPLQGFVSSQDLSSILNKMRLSNDVIWPLPITLRVPPSSAENLKEGEKVLIQGPDNISYAILDLEEKFIFPNAEICQKLFGTLDRKHPGVKRIIDSEHIFLSGKVTLINNISCELDGYNLSPFQVRKIFTEKGWAKILGFHTRNVIHRSHEFIQLNALKISGCDGLFLHPAIGQKKTGDFQSRIIMDTYDYMVKNIYPPNKVILAGFNCNSYYGGPREAIFTALCRKNYGCSHFIVGRDHTGVFDFYDPYDSQKIFDQFPDLGIEPIKCREVLYSVKKGYYYKEDSNENNLTDPNEMDISGSNIRKMIQQNITPDDHLMRTEIFELLETEISKGNDIFVQK